jgi:hypothetical protein
MMREMATEAEMRKLALAMPEAVEQQHFGDPDFRVREKIFAGLKGKSGRAWLKLGVDRQTALIAARPNVFAPAEGAWGRSGWTYVVLAQVALKELDALVHESWCGIAPKALVAQHLRSEPRSATRKMSRSRGSAEEPGRRGVARRRNPT